MKRAITLFLLLLTFAICLGGCTEPSNSTLTSEKIDTNTAGLVAHFIDVGQGDCTLLESKGVYALIDSGEYSQSNSVISYLSSQGVEELEFIISTHPHSDHCGGLGEVMRNFETKTLICPDADTDSNAWEYVLDAADERGVSFKTPSPGEEYALGSASVTILSPSADSDYTELNNYSIVCKAEYGNTSVMLTGDAEAIVEKELLNSSFDLSADILKCGHHGSRSSSSKDFLDAVNPSAAIICCGKDNDYGHPHTETLDALSKRNIPVYRTDTDGTITVSSDGEMLYISTAEFSAISISTAAKKPEVTLYIGNKNSKIFHEENCASAAKMKETNKIYIETREQAISKGYSPCGSCNP